MAHPAELPTVRLTSNRFWGGDFHFSIFTVRHTPESHPFQYCRNFWKIIYLFSGRSRKIIDGESYEIVPNMLLLVHPEERTRFEVPPGETLELCNIIFAPEVLDFARPLLEPHETFMKFFDPHKPVLSRSQRKRFYMV